MANTHNLSNRKARKGSVRVGRRGHVLGKQGKRRGRRRSAAENSGRANVLESAEDKSRIESAQHSPFLAVRRKNRLFKV